jgi:hypothetical protein
MIRVWDAGLRWIWSRASSRMRRASIATCLFRDPVNFVAPSGRSLAGIYPGIAYGCAADGGVSGAGYYMTKNDLYQATMYVAGACTGLYGFGGFVAGQFGW